MTAEMRLGDTPGTVNLFQGALDISYTQDASVRPDDLVVKAGPAGLMLADDLRLERALAVTRNVEWERAEVAFEGLRAVSVAVLPASLVTSPLLP